MNKRRFIVVTIVLFGGFLRVPVQADPSRRKYQYQNSSLKLNSPIQFARFLWSGESISGTIRQRNVTGNPRTSRGNHVCSLP